MPENSVNRAKHKKVAVGAVIAALTAVVLSLTCIKFRYLQLSNPNTGERLFRERVEDEAFFAVSFTHSVNKSPVSEEYRVVKSAIYLERIRYRSFGAGMPTEAEPGQVMTEENGYLIISGYDERMPNLVYSIGRIANHTLHIHGRDIPLNTLDEPGQPVKFTIEVYPLITVILREMS